MRNTGSRRSRRWSPSSSTHLSNISTLAISWHEARPRAWSRSRWYTMGRRVAPTTTYTCNTLRTKAPTAGCGHGLGMRATLICPCIHSYIRKGPACGKDYQNTRKLLLLIFHKYHGGPTSLSTNFLFPCLIVFRPSARGRGRIA